MASLPAMVLVMLTTAAWSGRQAEGPTCQDLVDVPTVVRIVGSEMYLSSGRLGEKDLVSCSLTPRTVGLPTLIRLYVRRDPGGEEEFKELRARHRGRIQLLYDLGEQAFYFRQDMAYPDRVGSTVGGPQREWGIAARQGAVTVVVSGVPDPGARETDAKDYLMARARMLLDTYATLAQP